MKKDKKQNSTTAVDSDKDYNIKMQCGRIRKDST